MAVNHGHACVCMLCSAVQQDGSKGELSIGNLVRHPLGLFLATYTCLDFQDTKTPKKPCLLPSILSMGQQVTTGISTRQWKGHAKDMYIHP